MECHDEPARESTFTGVITEARDTEHEAIRQLLVDAFIEDPGWRNYYSERGARERCLHRFYAHALRRAMRDGHVDILNDDTGQVVAVAVWYVRPPKSLWQRLHSRHHGHHRKARRWHLEAIVVAEAARDRGMGSRLLGHGLQRVDGDHAAATLEATTTASVRLYERHGFTPDPRRDRHRHRHEVPMTRPTHHSTPL